MTQAKIAQALVKAQQAFAPALKTNNNPFFKSKYADLSICIEAVIDSLHSNGIALIQRNHDCENGVKVETILLHESGEEYSGGVLHVPAAKNDPQGYGSALTYARRYSLMATCGIAPEDDDGNAASKTPIAKKTESTKTSLVFNLSQQEVDDCIAAMNGCDNLEALKGIFMGAYNRADDLQRKTLTGVKNAKKSLIEKAA